MKVVFSHGKESGPWGFKIKRLAEIAQQADCSLHLVSGDHAMNGVIKTVENLFDQFLASALTT